MRACGKRLVVEMAVPLDQMKNGLYIPESAQGVLRNLGKIISVGDLVDIGVKAGEYILVRGARSIPNLPYDVIEEADVICVVDEQDIQDIKDGKFAVKTEAQAVQ